MKWKPAKTLGREQREEAQRRDIFLEPETNRNTDANGWGKKKG